MRRQVFVTYPMNISHKGFLRYKSQGIVPLIEISLSSYDKSLSNKGPNCRLIQSVYTLFILTNQYIARQTVT